MGLRLSWWDRAPDLAPPEARREVLASRDAPKWIACDYFATCEAAESPERLSDCPGAQELFTRVWPEVDVPLSASDFQGAVEDRRALHCMPWGLK